MKIVSNNWNPSFSAIEINPLEDTSDAELIDKFLNVSNKKINEYFQKEYIETGYPIILETNTVYDFGEDSFSNWVLDRQLNLEYFEGVACTNMEKWCFMYVRNGLEIVLQIVFENQADFVLYKLCN